MRYPKLRELKETLKAIIRGPYTSKFPYQPHKPFERFRGRSEFHQDDCVGCGACFEVCPAKAIEMEDRGNKRVLTVHWDLCIFCGQCQANCLTEKGIMLSNEFDLATTEKRQELKQTIEKDLVLCECCGEIIAPYDQILWVAKKLGPLCFSNASLMLVYLNLITDINFNKTKADISSAVKTNPSLVREKQEIARSDRIKILCPCCRREAVYKS